MVVTLWSYGRPTVNFDLNEIANVIDYNTKSDFTIINFFSEEQFFEAEVCKTCKYYLPHIWDEILFNSPEDTLK